MRTDLHAFIQSSFRSVWALELLLFLRQRSERIWRSDELVAELRSSSAIVAQSLEALQSGGLVLIEADGVARYAPVSPDIDRLVAETAQVYRAKPGKVRRAILTNPNDKLSALADAFRIRKE